MLWYETRDPVVIRIALLLFTLISNGKVKSSSRLLVFALRDIPTQATNTTLYKIASKIRGSGQLVRRIFNLY